MLGLWAFWIEPASLRNEDYALRPPHWPIECGDLRVVVLGDLHVGSPFNGLPKLDEIITLTQAAEPDLILLAGDFVIHGVVGGGFETPEKIAHSLARLRAPMGVYAVLGNHDWWLDGPRVRRSLEAVGIPVLEDRATEIAQGQCRFWLVGVSDWWEGAHDVQGALESVPLDAAAVVFTHNPDVFPEIPDRVSLTIAAHTHGGQVYVPGWGRPIVPSAYGERFAIGHVIEGGRHLFVSSGLGTSILPVRFLVPPEISVLELRATRVNRSGEAPAHQAMKSERRFDEVCAVCDSSVFLESTNIGARSDRDSTFHRCHSVVWMLKCIGEAVMSDQKIPNVDFGRIPRELEGRWVVLRLGEDQEIVGQGETPQEAVLRSGTDPDDLRYALTQVPGRGPSAAWIASRGRTNVSR